MVSLSACAARRAKIIRRFFACVCTADRYAYSFGRPNGANFAFSGLSVQAILDRLPTAKVVEQNGRTSIIEAEVNHGRGIIMYLLSQGAWVKVLSPQSLVDEMQEELHQMLALYEKA